MSNSQKINEKGLLIILSSPSGAGKSTLAQRIRAWDKNCVFSISATTRKPREGEEDGKDYYFISEEEFNSKVSKNEMLEHAEVFGNLYGSPMSPVLSSIDNGNDVLFDVDWQGSQQIKNSSLGKYVLSIFILPPSIDELESRVWQLEFVVRGKYADEKYDERGTRGGKQRERRFGETHGASVSRRSRTRAGVEIVLR